MANPLMSRLGVANRQQPKSVAQQFKEFRASFRGDPQAKINEMLASGQITQEQLNQATELANLVKGFRKR